MYGLVSVTASAPPIILLLAPPLQEDKEADEAWLLLFDVADMSDALAFGPLIVLVEDGPPPSKLRETVERRCCWLGAKITGVGVVEASRREAVSSELP